MAIAATQQRESKTKMSTGSLTELITKVYGPYAFGIVSLLVLWMAVVKPELASQRINFEAQSVILGQMREIQEQQRIVSVNLQATSESLERIVDKIES